MSEGDFLLDGDRVLRLATRLVMFLAREATREGKARPSSLDVLCECEALEYAETFYHDVYLDVVNNRGVRLDEVKVRAFFERLMADTEG